MIQRRPCRRRCGILRESPNVTDGLSTLWICAAVARAFQFQRQFADAESGTEKSVQSVPGAYSNRNDSRPAGPDDHDVIVREARRRLDDCLRLYSRRPPSAAANCVSTLAGAWKYQVSPTASSV